MPFWTESVTFNTADPKRNYRFKIVSVTNTSQTTDSILGLGSQDGCWWAKKASQPTFSVSETEHNFLQHKYYWPARVTWNEVDITLVDPVDPAIQTSVMSYFNEAQLFNPSKGKWVTTSKGEAVQSLGNLQIQQLDDDGSVLNSWVLQHAWVKEVSFSELDYSNEDLMEITLKIRYDWAEYLNATGDA